MRAASMSAHSLVGGSWLYRGRGRVFPFASRRVLLCRVLFAWRSRVHDGCVLPSLRYKPTDVCHDGRSMHVFHRYLLGYVPQTMERTKVAERFGRAFFLYFSPHSRARTIPPSVYFRRCGSRRARVGLSTLVRLWRHLGFYTMLGAVRVCV